MPTISAEEAEQLVTTSLERVLAQFKRALEDTGAGGNVFFAFDTELHVDQIRRITVSAAGGPELWITRAGKHHISTANEINQGLLAMYVGRARWVTAEMLFLFLCDIVSNKPNRIPESETAVIVNLVIVEPYLYPQHALPIWLTVAHALATSQERDDLRKNLHDLPELNTDFDLLFQELPTTSKYPYPDMLRPGRKPAESLLAYAMRLLAAIRPDLADAIGEATTDEQRAHLFASHTAELQAYIRTQLYGRIAEAVSAANGSYAWRDPEDENPPGFGTQWRGGLVTHTVTTRD